MSKAYPGDLPATRSQACPLCEDGR